MSPVFLRRIFPMRTKCPVCQSLLYVPAGSSCGGNVLHRRCAAEDCTETYKISAIGEEWAIREDEPSELLSLAEAATYRIRQRASVPHPRT